PMLAARLPAEQPHPHGGLYHRLELAFQRVEGAYVRVLDWALGHRGTVLAAAAASFVVALAFGSLLGSEFFPPSDEGRMFVMMETPPGTSLEGTTERVKEAESWLLAQPELRGLFSGIGVSGPDGPGNATNAVFVPTLKPRAERTRSAQELMVAARKSRAEIPGIDVRVFDPVSMLSGGGRGELEFALRGNLPIEQLDQISDEIMHRLS